jgi:hypothetical protein
MAMLAMSWTAGKGMRRCDQDGEGDDDAEAT